MSWLDSGTILCAELAMLFVAIVGFIAELDSSLTIVTVFLVVCVDALVLMVNTLVVIDSPMIVTSVFGFMVVGCTSVCLEVVVSTMIDSLVVVIDS